MDYTLYARHNGHGILLSPEHIDHNMRKHSIKTLSFSCAVSGIITYDESDKENPFLLRTNGGKHFRSHSYEEVLKQAVLPSFLWWEDDPEDFSVRAE